jgi:hypothetical protein
MAVNERLDAGEVGFERVGQDGAALGDLLDLAGDEAVDARAAVGELSEISFQRTRQDVAAFGQLTDVASDHFINVRTGLDEFLGGLRRVPGQAVHGPGRAA